MAKNTDTSKEHAATDAHNDELTEDEKRQLEEKFSIDTDSEHTVSDETADESDASDDRAVIDAKKAVAPSDVPNNKPPGKLKRFFRGYWRKKAWTVPVTLVIVLVAVAFAWPWSRYLILGQYIERPYSIVLVDTKTHKPISSAHVAIGGVQATTDAKGQATLHAKVGPGTVTVDKKYYQSLSQPVFVGITKQKGSVSLSLTATGRQVPIVIVNKITGKPVANAVLESTGTQIKTGKDGKAIMVLPADKPTLSGTVSGQGFNNLKVTIQITESVVPQNTFAVVPLGKVYFLSKLSGKIDVVKTDLDGGNRQTVIYGTGKEDEGGTVLLSSRDWKYLALLSKRDSDPAKLYLIDTTTDKMTTMDEGDAQFDLSGWSGHNFAYTVTRNKVAFWQTNRQAVKVYDAEKKQILTVDQSQAEGGQNDFLYQTFGGFTLLRDKLLYTASWNHSFSGWYSPLNLTKKTTTIREVTVGASAASAEKELRNFPSVDYYYVSVVPYSPVEAYLIINGPSKTTYAEYDDGELKDVSDSDAQKIQNTQLYPTHLTSPSGSQTFWTEPRDGRDTFFVGDASGNNAKQVAALDDEYQVYGWYTDNFLLLSKKGSELYIMPVTGGTPLKITDYHKPQFSYRGYGGGYGGL